MSRECDGYRLVEVGKMKKVLCGLVLLGSLAFFSASMAQDLPRIFSGRITEIDSNAGTVVVKDGERDMAFPISDDTKIKTEYGVAVPFKELKNDTQVTVEYQMKDGNTIQPLSIKTIGMRKGFGKKQKEKQKKK
jgi:hypothetical protein